MYINKRFIFFIAFTGISFMSWAQPKEDLRPVHLHTVSFRFKLNVISERGIKAETVFNEVLNKWDYGLEIIFSSDDKSFHLAKVQSPYPAQHTLKRLRNIIIHDFYGRQITLGYVCNIQNDQSR